MCGGRSTLIGQAQ